MPILDKITSILTGGIASVVLDAVDKLTLSKEEKAQIQATILAETNRNAEALAGQVVELAKVDAEDRATARARETTLRNSVGVWVQNSMAIVAILSFVALTFSLIIHKIPTENKEVAMLMVGTLQSVAVMIFSYWFGSSRSSESKQATIDTMISKTNF